MFSAPRAIAEELPVETFLRTYEYQQEKRGKKFELIVKPDEGHGFHKEENKIEFYRKVDEFLKENLK